MGRRIRAIRERLRFRRWGKWLLAGGAAFLLISVIGVEATSRPAFCNSCHVMEPYYTSWRLSAHKDVSCVGCHISPGVDSFLEAKLNGLGQVVDDALNRTSNKPSASVSQLSCTRSGCHDLDTIAHKEAKNGLFKFRHDKHVGTKHLGVEISCGTCHSHVKGDQHFEVNTSVCITCHLVDASAGRVEKLDARRGSIIHLGVRSAPREAAIPRTHVGPNGEKPPPASCTSCHDAPKEEIVFEGIRFDHAQFLAFGASCESCHQGVTATPPPIEDGRCLQCHTFGVEKRLETHEMHRAHTLGRHKIECASCHGMVRHGTHVQTVSLEEFDCTRCHIDQHSIQRRTYFTGPIGPHVEGTVPSHPMFVAHVDCTGCHVKPRPVGSSPESGAQVLAAAPEACDKCHQPGLGERMIPLWQRTARSLYDQVEAQLASARAEGIDIASAAEVAKMLAMVKADGSWGVHNPVHTQQLLEQARTRLAVALAAKRKAP